MASRKEPCRPCQQDDRNTTANIWCYNCDEGLCLSCSNHHAQFKSTHDHKTIDIQNHKPLVGSNKTECDIHRQRLMLYCPNHLMPCCDECISQSHLKCIGITSLASVVEKTNIEKSKESVGKEIHSILHFLNKLANNKFENIQKGEKQYQSIKESISIIRVEINKHLDNLEKKLLKEADTIWGQEKSKLTDFVKEIEEQKKRLKEMQDDLRIVQEHTSKLQSFLEVHQIEQHVHKCQLYVDEHNETIREVDIKLKQNYKTEQILSKVQSLTSLGEVNVNETEVILKKETSFGREGQVELQYQPNVNNMTMTTETKKRTIIEYKDSCSDILCLLDGRVIVVEEWRQVIILSSDMKLQKELPIEYGAWGVTQIKRDTIALTFPKRRIIEMFNMDNETITNIIILDKICYGLVFSKNALFVGLSSNEIRVIDLEGHIQRSFEVWSETNLYHLVYFNDRVIFSDYHGKSVSCVDGSGNQVWQYQNDLLGPRGLCADTYGNIIVADRDSDRILVISKDGQESKVLISGEDRMTTPRCICLNESSGFISRNLLGGICISKFNIAYE